MASIPKAPICREYLSMKAALSVKDLVSRTGLPTRAGELAMAAGCVGEMTTVGFLPPG
jgi:hypothetical protein